MEYESSHSEKRPEGKETNSSVAPDSWYNVLSIPDDDIEMDEDCPEYDPRYFSEPVLKVNGRVIPPKKSPTDPIDPELLAFMKSITPLIQMEPEILGGMPVFRGTLVPLKRMFDYLLAGRSLDEFLAAHPTVPRDTALNVLGTERTLFYEEISKAIDSAAMPSSRPR
ncbi:DUF433 domain-containing protein [Duganella aceris]|nr:DUF433 domain-containing protein [Duganella aceris]